MTIKSVIEIVSKVQIRTKVSRQVEETCVPFGYVFFYFFFFYPLHICMYVCLVCINPREMKFMPR